MAQTKRKRRTKHRGNAAGTVEVRGRTGRPPTPDEKKQKEKVDRAAAREARLSKPPSWRSAFNRALVATGLMFVLLLFVSKGSIVGSVVFAVIALGLYTSFGYYIDSWQYKRRMKQKQAARQR